MCSITSETLLFVIDNALRDGEEQLKERFQLLNALIEF